jgi:hypothetical protein
MDQLEKLMRKLPPVPEGRSAGIACVIGFLFGGIGLAIYLWNIVDLVVPVFVVLLASAILGVQGGWLLGALFAALYGYFRVGVFVPETEPAP